MLAAALLVGGAGSTTLAQTVMAPGAPTIGSVTAGTNSLTVTWSAPASNGGATITSYDLRYIESDAEDKTVDANWTLVAGAWTSGSLSSVLDGLPDSVGYDVQVRAVNSAGAGDWSATATGTTSDHSGSRSGATTLAVDSSVMGRIDPDADEDYFRIVLSAQTNLWVYSSGRLDTTGELQNSSGSVLDSNDNSILPHGGQNFSLYQRLAAGTYYVKVGSARTRQSGAYELHARAVTEPGDTVATAVTVEPGTLTAAMVDPNTEDMFKIELANNATLAVLAMVGSAGAVDMELLDASENAVSGATIRDTIPLDSGFASDQRRSALWAELTAGTYYVVVSSADSGTITPYTLYAETVSDAGATAATGTETAIESLEPGKIDSSSDVDYYRFTLAHDTHVVMTAYPFNSGQALPMTATVFDANGTDLEVYTASERIRGIDGPDGESFLLRRYLAAGTYDIRITGSTVGPYLLHTMEDGAEARLMEACQRRSRAETDPLYGCQWHLKNTRQFDGSAGYDINVEGVWADGITGTGVRVAVIGEGLDQDHDTLKENVDAAAYTDYVGNAGPSTEEEGTRVAGVIAAPGDDLGVRGVAPGATIYGVRLTRDEVSDALAAAAMLANSSTTAVSSNVWDSRTPTGRWTPVDDLWEQFVEDAVETGYGGKGVFYVFPAGDNHLKESEYSNLDERVNYYAVTTVCAVNHKDVRASYSEMGPNLWVCAPSGDAAMAGITTTRAGNRHTSIANRTGMATGIVAGVAALIREANPDLTWRDVKLILAASARRNHTADSGWQQGQLQYGSTSERYWFNHKYGFGVVDAGAAVALATNDWQLLPAMRTSSATSEEPLDIPDHPGRGQPAITVTQSVTLPPYVTFVEFIEVEVRITHRYPRDLRVQLVSPSGAVSTLATQASAGSRLDDATFRFGSAKHLGEPGVGEWTLRITDLDSLSTGTLHSWTLTAYGHGTTPDAPAISTTTGGSEAITIAWSAPSDAGASAISAYDLRYIRSDATDKSDANWTVVEEIWTSGALSYELTGLSGGTHYDLQVRAVNDSGDGRWSATSEDNTSAVAPSEPRNVVAHARHEELRVTWEPPASGAVGMQRYELRHILTSATDKDDDANWTTVTSAWTSGAGGALRYVITSLADGTSYDVQVRAVNSEGTSAWSATSVGVPAIVNTAPSFPATESGERSHSEGGAGIGRPFGAPVVAIDPEGDRLTYSVTGSDVDEGHIYIEPGTGQLVFATFTDYETRDSYAVTVQVTDGLDVNGEPDDAIDATQDVAVTILNVNEIGLIAGPKWIDVDENTEGVIGEYTIVDPEGDTITWDVAFGRLDTNHFLVEAGEVDPADPNTSTGLLKLYMPLDYEDPQDRNRDNEYQSGVSASDGGILRQETVWVRILDVEEAPVFAEPLTLEHSIDENSGTYVGEYTATDPDHPSAGNVDVTLGGTDASAFDFENDVLSFKVTPDHEDERDANRDSVYQVSLVATDRDSVTTTVNLTITVVDVNEPPTVSGPVDEHFDENAAGVVASYSADDPDAGDTITWSLEGSDRTLLTIDSSGNVEFVDPPNHEARNPVYNVVVKATDAAGLFDTRTLQVTVNDLNEPPEFTAGPETVSYAENGTGQVGRYLASDPDMDDAFMWDLRGVDAGDFMIDSNGVLTFVATPDYESPTDANGDREYIVIVEADDGAAIGTRTVTVTVTDVDEPGTLQVPPQPQEDALFAATFSEGDAVSTEEWEWHRSTSSTSGWTVISGATSSSYTPVSGDVGYYLRATVEYNDGHGVKTLQRVSANAVEADEPDNQPPEFPSGPIERSVPENSAAPRAVGAVVVADDPDDSPGDLLYELSGSVLFTIDTAGGQIRVAPGAVLDHEAADTYSVTVRATDPSSASDSATVTIEVTDVNEAPTAVLDRLTVNEDEEITTAIADLMTNDTDPDDSADFNTLTFSRHSNPRNGTLTRNLETLIYRPRANFHGDDSFTYTISDGQYSSTATVEVTVNSVNDPPEFNEGATATRSVVSNAQAGTSVGTAVIASDADGDPLTYSLSGPGVSFFEIDQHSGEITVREGVTLTVGDTAVTVTAGDGNGGVANIDVTITVSAAPVPTGTRRSPIFIGGGFGGGGGGGGGPSGPTPSQADFEWTVKHDLEALDGGNDAPTGVWSDGTTLWVADNPDGAGDAIYAYDLETGARVEGLEFVLSERNRAPRGVWSDRTTIWVSDSGRDRLFAYDLATGEPIEDRDIVLAERNGDVRGIWSDGETMWVLDGGTDSLFAYDLATGDLLAEYPLDSRNSDPQGIWSDGVTIWVSDAGASPRSLFAYRLPVPPDEQGEGENPELERVRDEDFTELSQASNNSPRGIWSDGAVMYVADASDGKVYTYNLPDAIDARLASLTLSGIDIGEFDPAQTDYEGVIAEGVTETVVVAEAMQRRTDIAIDPPDGDEEADGHQVSLQGVSEIAVTVTSADGSRERVYRVRLEAPEVSVALEPGWNSLAWPGAEGTSVSEALQTAGLADNVVAVYYWDEAAGTWLGYFPGVEGVPGLNTLTVFSSGVTYWIAAAEAVSWTLEGTGADEQ